MQGVRALGAQLACFLMDVVVAFYVLVLGCYVFGQIAYVQESFLLIPWWLAVVVVVESALLWESFGVSIGMRITRLRLTTSTGEDPAVAKRSIRFILLHLLGLPLIGTLPSLWDRERRTLYDRLSRTSLTKVEESGTKRLPWYRKSSGVGVVLLSLLTAIAAVFLTEIRLGRLVSGAPFANIIIRNLVRPDWSILSEGVGLLIETLYMALMATLFGMIVAIPLSFLAARNLSTGIIGRLVYFIVRTAMSITRSIEPLIWAVIFVLWVRLGTFPGMLALFVHSIADLTKLYSERLESIDQGPVEAIRAAGGSRLQVIRYGVIPQIINPYLSFTLYRWDINVRMSTIIGIVGGGGIGQLLFILTRSWKWRQVGTLVLLIVLTVWTIDYVSSKMRARIE